MCKCPLSAFLLVLASAAFCFAENQPVITLPLIDKNALADARNKIARHDAAYQKAYDALHARADEWLKTAPPTVMDKTRIPPSGDKHDYMSLATYWYANPATTDGMPWIRRDGERNPLTMSKEFDRAAMSSSTNAIIDLSLTYSLSGEQKYADHAVRMIRAWFLDAATHMNPHLEFGQAIPGVNAGRCIGIIDTSSWAFMLDTIELLQDSPAWTQSDHQALQKWFSQYVDWLTNSTLGKEEESQKNNHGTWYDVQVARFALFAQRPEVARAILEKAKTKRIPEQIESDGRMPLELARTKAFTYSAFNVRAFFYLARMGDRLGIDLWHFSTPDGRNLKKPLDFLAPYADPSLAWPHRQIGEDNYRTTLQPLLRMGAAAYHDTRYTQLLKQFPASDRDVDIAMFVVSTVR